MVDSIADMDRNTSVNPEEILSEEELVTLRLAEKLYSIRAKQAAANLAQALELTVEVRGQILGAMALRLASLEFEQRREVAIKFTELSEIFGGVTAAAETVSLDLITTEPETDPLPDDGAEPLPVPLPGEADAAGSNDDNDEDDADSTSSPEASNADLNLNDLQLTWLARIYGVETAEILGAMPKDKFDEFLTNLTEHYLSLRIRRLTPRAKIVRVEQLKLLMDNKLYKEIALQFNTNSDAVSSGLRSMAGGIARTASKEELLALIPGLTEADTAEPVEPAEEEIIPEEEAIPLTKDQQRWLSRLIDNPQIIGIIESMGPAKRGYLATRLSQRLYPAIVRRYGPEISRIRTAILTQFLEGVPAEEIAAARSITTEAVKHNLNHAANRLKDTIEPDKLVALVLEAQSFIPTEPTEE